MYDKVAEAKSLVSNTVYEVLLNNMMEDVDMVEYLRTLADEIDDLDYLEDALD